VTIQPNTNLDPEDPSDIPEHLTLLETRVFQLAWNGAKHTDIAQRIQRDPRTVARMLTGIARKIGGVDPGFLRLRLEAELLARIPSMSNRDLIAALRLYRPQHGAAPNKSSLLAAQPGVQQVLREVMAVDAAVAPETG
jgi:hypothetical protein